MKTKPKKAELQGWAIKTKRGAFRKYDGDMVIYTKLEEAIFVSMNTGDTIVKVTVREL